MSDFSSNLRRLRKRAGLSQDALAEKLSVTRQTVSSWERGNSYPDLDMLVHISDALATDPNELLYPNQKRRSGGVSRLVNCTPFVRQYGILSNKWGVLLCQKEYQTNDIRRNSRSW